MTEHIFLPRIKLENVELLPEHKNWLISWMGDLEGKIDDGNVSSSICLQGIISEIVLYTNPKIDWIGVMNEYLTDEEGVPLAYSEKYGKRLYAFNQWLQRPVHAIHTRWWIDGFCESSSEIEERYCTMIENLIQPNGWIYNPQVSITQYRTRMRSELMMSLAMGIEILDSFDHLSKFEKDHQATLSSEHLTGYLSAEYFRLKALEMLKSPKLAPVDLDSVLQICEAVKGYCDFSIESKVDDYMGTAKRTARDKPVHSPLAGIQANYIASNYGKEETRSHVMERLETFGAHLRLNPLDIPAFRIRNLDVPFGTDISPLEIIAASFIAKKGFISSSKDILEI